MNIKENILLNSGLNEESSSKKEDLKKAVNNIESLLGRVKSKKIDENLVRKVLSDAAYQLGITKKYRSSRNLGPDVNKKLDKAFKQLNKLRDEVY